MFTIANNLALHYRIEGRSDGPPLVFLHSLGCDLRIWDQVVPAFTQKYRVVCYDLRGHGLSDAPPGPYTIRDHARDLSALLTHLGMHAAVLVGISVGGLIAMDFALLQPGRARGLALCDTAPKIGTADGWNERIRAVRERGLGGMAETILGRWFATGFARNRPAEYHGCRNMLARNPVEGYVATCAALRDTDLTGLVGEIDAPALAVCGAEDLTVTPEQTRAWAGSMRKARVEILPEAAHLPCIEQPAALAVCLETFFREDCHAAA